MYCLRHFTTLLAWRGTFKKNTNPSAISLSSEDAYTSENAPASPRIAPGVGSRLCYSGGVSFCYPLDERHQLSRLIRAYPLYIREPRFALPRRLAFPLHVIPPGFLKRLNECGGGGILFRARTMASDVRIQLAFLRRTAMPKKKEFLKVLIQS